MTGSALRRLRSGVRGRSAALTTLVVAVVMVAGSAVLVLQLQAGVRADVRAAARARLGEVAARLHDGTGPALRRDIELHTHEGQLVQAIGPDGHILAASSARAAGRPLTPLRPPAGVTLSTRARPPALGGQHDYLVLARTVQSPRGTVTVVVLSSLETVSDSVGKLVGYLLAALPLALLLVAAGTWLVVGRALRPVEQVREQVATIESTDLTRRVPVPITHDEVQRLAGTMNQMLARLEEGQQRQRRFVADASHELRSPLTTLSASLEVAAASAPDPALHAIMQAEVARMKRLVDDLLLLARADDHGLRLDEEEVDLDDVVHTEVVRLRPGADVTVEEEVRPVRVRGDAGRLGQLVANLVENATHAADSRVRVSLSSSHTDALLVVEDDGPGIPPEDRARIFDRFVRLDAGRSRHHGGSGLGLAIVREIARSHRMTVLVGDSPLGGARFELRMACEPLADIDEAWSAPPDAGQPPDRLITPPSGSSR
ncbi:MAG TPA: HAMP domain-containing sensor histidine kinase [Marmoricola sp.]